MVGVPPARLARARALRAAWAACPPPITLVTVATANHLLADAVPGAAAVALTAVAARAPRRVRPPGRAGRAPRAS